MEDTKFERDQLVTACDPIYGTYIGHYQELHHIMWNSPIIKILACTVYPSQSTVMYAHMPFERLPYTQYSLHAFEGSRVKPYEGPVPEYKESVKVALSKAIDSAREQGNINIAVKLRNHLAETA